MNEEGAVTEHVDLLSAPLTVDRAAVKAVASWVVDDDDFDEAMGALEDALHARYHTKTVADLSEAVAARSATPSSEEAEPRIEPGHNHTTDGLPTFPVFRDACPLGCDVVRAGEIVANTGRRPNLAVVDPFAEVAAIRALAHARATPDNAGRSSIEYDDHEFYQDALPREMGRCDYTYPTGEPCGEDRGFHWHERSSIDVERLARALFAVHPRMYPEAWPDDDPDDVGPHPDEDARAIAAEYARLSESTGSEEGAMSDPTPATEEMRP